MRIALVSLQRAGEADRRLAFSEPVHLVGMHNRLLKNGIGSMVTDTSCESWKDEVRRFSPDIVGITAPTRELIPEHFSFVEELKAAGLPIILGGVQATLDPAFYAEVYKPAAIVLSQGEPVMDSFIKNGFMLDLMKNSPFFEGSIGSTLIFRSDKLMPLDNIDYTRPYSLESYFSAWPTPVFGCTGQCVFCLPDRRIVFRSPDKFLQEMIYLAVENKADFFETMGPDFTASPSHATEIIRLMLSRSELMGKYYAITSRVDTLSKALLSDKAVWKDFLNRNTVEFCPGIESFLPARLMRLGKYGTLEMAEKQDQNLKDILDLISGTKATLRSTLIMIDPESTIAEINADLLELERFTNAYPGKFLISAGDVFSFLRSAPGTKLDEMYKIFSDSLLMPKTTDPAGRLLLLLLNLYFFSVKIKAAAEYTAGSNGLNLQEQNYMNQAITLNHINKLRYSLETVEDFSRGANLKEITGEHLVEFTNYLTNLHFPEI